MARNRDRNYPLPPAGPFIRAPEATSGIFNVIILAACGPLLAGVVMFGWQVLIITAVCIASCVTIEKLIYRILRTPAAMGKSHAYLTGILLALTLPATVPWYVAIIASAFAIIIGKAVFGGVGHFLWQPALVGRLAVAVMFPALVAPATWSVLSQGNLVIGDINNSYEVENFTQWTDRHAPDRKQAFKIAPPASVLAGLTSPDNPAFSSLAYQPTDYPKPAALMKMPPIKELFIGARPGGIGETCIIVIIVSGLYLVYRNYVKWVLPVSMGLSAAIAIAIAPIWLAGADGGIQKIWFPIAYEGFDVGFVYVCYQLLSCELVLAALFFAPEMTSRPVTIGGQVIFGLACGVIGVILKVFLQVPIPFYLAILVVNTFTPVIDAVWKPKVLGKPSIWNYLTGLKVSQRDRQTI